MQAEQIGRLPSHYTPWLSHKKKSEKKIEAEP
jgi:hypothetical protein